MTTINSHAHGFPKRYRMITANDYRQVFIKPKRVSTPELLFLYSENYQSTSRLGLAIAKKQIPKAVDRNRVKRLIRESFRNQREQINSLDIVVMARKSLLNMDNTKVLHQLEKLWQQVIHRGKAI